MKNWIETHRGSWKNQKTGVRVKIRQSPYSEAYAVCVISDDFVEVYHTTSVQDAADYAIYWMKKHPKGYGAKWE